MMDRLREFFSRLFGGGNGASVVEDASDLGDANLTTVPADTSNPYAGRATMRSRGLSDTDAVIDVGDSSLDDITITQPRYLWLLDNGHGSEQNGKRSPHFEDGTRFEEWEFNRDVVRRMAKRLDRAGVQYYVVVPEDKVGSFLRERVERANKKESPLGLPKIFVSVHSNAIGLSDWNNRASGIEVWHYPNSDSGQRLASAFQRALLKRLPEWVDRGLKSHTSGSSKVFYVLGNTSMPAVLTENGFYTHEEEAKRLMTDETRQAIADAHVDAILTIEQAGWEDIEIYGKAMQVG
jgi:N-acetylmuramoyl-L-alanine amidase